MASSMLATRQPRHRHGVAFFGLAKRDLVLHHPEPHSSHSILVTDGKSHLLLKSG